MSWRSVWKGFYEINEIAFLRFLEISSSSDFQDLHLQSWRDKNCFLIWLEASPTVNVLFVWQWLLDQQGWWFKAIHLNNLLPSQVRSHLTRLSYGVQAGSESGALFGCRQRRTHHLCGSCRPHSCENKAKNVKQTPVRTNMTTDPSRKEAPTKFPTGWTATQCGHFPLHLVSHSLHRHRNVTLRSCKQILWKRRTRLVEKRQSNCARGQRFR